MVVVARRRHFLVGLVWLLTWFQTRCLVCARSDSWLFTGRWGAQGSPSLTPSEVPNSTGRHKKMKKAKIIHSTSTLRTDTTKEIVASSKKLKKHHKTKKNGVKEHSKTGFVRNEAIQRPQAKKRPNNHIVGESHEIENTVSRVKGISTPLPRTAKKRKKKEERKSLSALSQTAKTSNTVSSRVQHKLPLKQTTKKMRRTNAMVAEASKDILRKDSFKSSKRTKRKMPKCDREKLSQVANQDKEGVDATDKLKHQSAKKKRKTSKKHSDAKETSPRPKILDPSIVATKAELTQKAQGADASLVRTSLAESRAEPRPESISQNDFEVHDTLGNVENSEASRVKEATAAAVANASPPLEASETKDEGRNESEMTVGGEETSPQSGACVNDSGLSLQTHDEDDGKHKQTEALPHQPSESGVDGTLCDNAADSFETTEADAALIGESQTDFVKTTEELDTNSKSHSLSENLDLEKAVIKSENKDEDNRSVESSISDSHPSFSNPGSKPIVSTFEVNDHADPSAGVVVDAQDSISIQKTEECKGTNAHNETEKSPDIQGANKQNTNDLVTARTLEEKDDQNDAVLHEVRSEGTNDTQEAKASQTVRLGKEEEEDDSEDEEESIQDAQDDRIALERSEDAIVVDWNPVHGAKVEEYEMQDKQQEEAEEEEDDDNWDGDLQVGEGGQHLNTDGSSALQNEDPYLEPDVVSFIGQVLHEDVDEVRSWTNAETSCNTDSAITTTSLNETRGGALVIPEKNTTKATSRAESTESIDIKSEADSNDEEERDESSSNSRHRDAHQEKEDHHSPYIIEDSTTAVSTHAENEISKGGDGTLASNQTVATSIDEAIASPIEVKHAAESEGRKTMLDRKTLETAEDKNTDVVVSVVTWNLAEESPSEDDAQFLRKFRKLGIKDGQGSDLILISGQECENIKPRRSEGSRSREYRRLMIKMLGKQYVPIGLHLLGGIQFGLFAKKSLLKEIEHVSIADVTCGIGNVFHNKGAIAAFVQLKARNSSSENKNPRSKTLRMMFVTAHMAAHVKNSDARDSDFWRISNELEAQAPEGFLPRQHPDSADTDRSFLFDSVDRVFFCGDLNYRVDLPREVTENTILTDSTENARLDLMKHDQLFRTLAEGRAFPGFAEAKISFAPTFKFDKDTGDYDTSHKQRIPAWTDRILFKPWGTRVLEYTSVPEAQHSDHRPVLGTFRVNMEGRELPPAKRRRKKDPKK